MPNVFDEEFRRRLLDDIAWGFAAPSMGYEDPFEYIPYGSSPPTNTFRRTAMPRPGFIDARRADGCVPCITTLR